MSDAYLAIAAIAKDQYMIERLNACATQQAYLGNAPLLLSVGNPPDPTLWVTANAYRWAGSPGWGEKWHAAYVEHPDDDAYEPGKDPDVITDNDILAAVQHLGSTN